MVLLFYVFLVHGQMMIGRAEFDTYERCVREGIPRAKAEHPKGDAACLVLERP